MTFDVTNPAKPTTKHDPQARLDYEWDLDSVLDVGDTLASVAWTAHLGSFTGPIVPGATVETAILGARAAWAWVSISDPTQTGDAGTPTLVGQTLCVTCHFVTVGTRVDERSLFFKLTDR